MKTMSKEEATTQEAVSPSENGSNWCHDHTGRGYTFEEAITLIRDFHGYPAPGLILGVRMVSSAMEKLPKEILFDAISETRSCLPDAVQLLTLCTIGNSWLKVLDLGRYAVTLYDKYTGDGARVSIDSQKLKKWPELQTWLYKLKPKHEQDSSKLIREIQNAGTGIYVIEPVVVTQQYLGKKSKGNIGTCPVCIEAYPQAHGSICRACQGETPYGLSNSDPTGKDPEMPWLKKIDVEEATGRQILHDMTEVIPGKEKGPAFKQGQIISSGDICRLQQMGRQHVYVEDHESKSDHWIHEDRAALAFARNMAGEGVIYQEIPHEGKITLSADRDGLFAVDTIRLEAFNMIPNVMCASRKRYEVMTKGKSLAATRAIPLYMDKVDFHRAMAVLRPGPIFQILPLRKAHVGILVTGTEVFRGLIQDSFIPIIESKVTKYGCNVADAIIRPDDRGAIKNGIFRLLKSGADLIVTTAGLSVDPDDVTRQGLIDAGCTEMLYGAPILPGAMTLLSKIGDTQIIGVPACGLYHTTTGFDLLLPRLLANMTITRQDLAALGHGAFCQNCKTCSFPHCSYGK
jgi:formylmethanofuran dehydrogenase subunit E